MWPFLLILISRFNTKLEFSQRGVEVSTLRLISNPIAPYDYG